MAEKTIGLSPDLIIHPGETLSDILKDRNITQTELAHRTGVSKAHVSKIINGEKDVSVSYAKKLEYALGIEANFWVNLQANYDCEKAEFEDKHSITEEEINIISQLKDFIDHIQRIGLIGRITDKSFLILELRRWLGISNLGDITKLAFSGAFRVSDCISINVYVLYAWVKLCQVHTSQIVIQEALNTQKLIDNIPRIKSLMLHHTSDIQGALQKIFASCGVSFSIEKNFTGAPVQGYIRKNSDGTLSLSMTIRGAFADIFWFTLFHEIGHIINKDFGSKSFIDYTASTNEMEEKANEFASQTLLNQEMYENFLKHGDYSLQAISDFASTQGVPNYIVIGRMQKDNKLDYKQYANQKVKYKWID